MTSICLRKLISKLNSKITYTNFKSFKNKLNYNICNWEKFMKFNNKTYCRNRIYKNDLFEIVLITWRPGDCSKLHSHPENGCIMKLLKGTLYETIVSNQNKTINNQYHTKDVSYIDDKKGRHIISNLSDKLSVSLHLYSPPSKL